VVYLRVKTVVSDVNTGKFAGLVEALWIIKFYRLMNQDRFRQQSGHSRQTRCSNIFTLKNKMEMHGKTTLKETSEEGRAGALVLELCRHQNYFFRSQTSAEVSNLTYLHLKVAPCNTPSITEKSLEKKFFIRKWERKIASCLDGRPSVRMCKR
jgi:hypothetical protein